MHQHTRDPPPSGTLSLHLRSTRGQSLHMGQETRAHHRTGALGSKAAQGPPVCTKGGMVPTAVSSSRKEGWATNDPSRLPWDL